MDGYRFPLRGLRPEEAEALLILGVPAALRELGLDGALTAAHRQIQVTAGLATATLVHLDMPRWFGGQQEEAPCLRELAQALRLGRKLALEYRSAEARDGEHRDGDPRVVGPLGLVNKAGTWYLVATPGPGDIRVFRAGRVLSARVLPEAFGRPADFELAGFWAQWSAEFEASRPRLQVRLTRLASGAWRLSRGLRPGRRARARGGGTARRGRLAGGHAVVRARAGGCAPAGWLRRPGRGPRPSVGPGQAAGHGPRDPRTLRCCQVMPIGTEALPRYVGDDHARCIHVYEPGGSRQAGRWPVRPRVGDVAADGQPDHVGGGRARAAPAGPASTRDTRHLAERHRHHGAGRSLGPAETDQEVRRDVYLRDPRGGGARGTPGTQDSRVAHGHRSRRHPVSRGRARVAALGALRRGRAVHRAEWAGEKRLRSRPGGAR